MTRNMVRGGAMVATLLVLAGCDRPGPTPVQQATPTPDVAGATGTLQPPKVPTVAFSAYSFTQVPATPCTGNPGEAVVWTLSDVFSGLNNNRRVKRDIMRGAAKVPEIPQTEVGNNWPTNLDMDISSAGSDYVMVTIVLKTGATGGRGGVHFLRPRIGPLPTGPDPSGNDSSEAVLSRAAHAGPALDHATQELIALAIGVATRCEPCIAYHAEGAIKAGATRDQVAETLAMAVYMGAGPSVRYAAKALEAVDQFTSPA